MAKFPTVQSKDGRVVRVVTSQDELDALKAQGYKPVRKPEEVDTSAREPIDSGAEGNRRARASSTTEGSERNSGSTATS